MTPKPKPELFIRVERLSVERLTGIHCTEAFIDHRNLIHTLTHGRCIRPQNSKLTSFSLTVWQEPPPLSSQNDFPKRGSSWFFKCIIDEYKYISKCRALACFFGTFVLVLHFVYILHGLRVSMSFPSSMYVYQSVLYHSLTFVFSNSADATRIMRFRSHRRRVFLMMSSARPWSCRCWSGGSHRRQRGRIWELRLDVMN